MLNQKESIILKIKNNMKYLFILFLVVFAGFNCSSSKQYSEWSVVQLNYESGPISPEYQYSYSVIINNNKTCEYIYIFPMSNEKKLQYSFSISKEQYTGLQEAIEKSLLIGKEIPKLPDEQVPIGGSLTTVKITVVDPDPNSDKPPKVYQSPYFPEKAYEKNLDELYKYINRLVPEEILKKSSGERDAYLNNLKDN